MIDYRVYLVTDDPSRYAGDWLENIEAAVAGGVTCVQYRDTESCERDQYSRLLALKDMLSRTKTPLIVNNNVGLALAVDADAIHVGQGDLPPSVVRRLVGGSMEIGLSITSKDQLAQIDSACVDCIGIGPVYDATKTKADAAPEMGLAGLSEIAAASAGLPNVAIGGISLERAPGIIAAGALGLAVVSAFSKSADPEETARSFRALFESGK